MSGQNVGDVDSLGFGDQIQISLRHQEQVAVLALDGLLGGIGRIGLTIGGGVFRAPRGSAVVPVHAGGHVAEPQHVLHSLGRADQHFSLVG